MPSKNTTPEIIYHYTTQKGLLGILDEKAIWTTNLFYLNDSSEYLHAADLAKKEIQNKIDKYEKELSKVNNYLTLQSDPELKLKQTIIGRLKNFTEVLSLLNGDIQIFVCSFSEKRDHLGQWRGYCRDENGYSIGFDYAELKKLSKEQEFILDRCIYSPTEKKPKILNLIEPLFKSVPSTKDAESIFLNDFFEIAPTIKRYAFHDEYEWRIISKAIFDKPVHVFFKEGKSTIIPYVKFQLGENIPIKEITIGPTPNEKLSMRAIRLLKNQKELKNVEIIPSKIPYRHW